MLQIYKDDDMATKIRFAHMLHRVLMDKVEAASASVAADLEESDITSTLIDEWQSEDELTSGHRPSPRVVVSRMLHEAVATWLDIGDFWTENFDSVSEDERLKEVGMTIRYNFLILSIFCIRETTSLYMVLLISIFSVICSAGSKAQQVYVRDLPNDD